MPRRPQPPKLDLNDRGTWEIRWSDQGRSKRVQTGMADRLEAQQFFAGWLKGEDEQAQPDAVTVGLVIDRYMLDRPPTQTTKNLLASVRAEWGKRRVTEITPQLCREYVATRQRAKRRHGDPGKPLSISTIRVELEYLNAALNHAKAERLITDAPVIKRPAAAPPRDIYLTDTELGRVLQAAAARRKGLRLSPIERWLWLSIYTAARPDAVKGLTWKRVLFDEGLIDYRDPTVKTQPKKRRVQVPIAAPLRAILERAYQERLGPYVCDAPDGLDLRNALRPVLRDCAIAKKIIPYTFRHTWATLASMRAVPMGDIARVLGNTIAVCERVYAKYHPDYLKGTVDTMPDLSGFTPGVQTGQNAGHVVRNSGHFRRNQLPTAADNDLHSLSVGRVGSDNATPN